MNTTIDIGGGLFIPPEPFNFRPAFSNGFKGLVYKQGHKVKNWKQRYLALENGELKYFVDEEATQLKGSWVVNSSCSVSMLPGVMDGRDNLIELIANRSTGESDVLFISTKSKDDQHVLLRAIQEVIAGGMIEIVQPDVWDKFRVEGYLSVQFKDPQSKLCISLDGGNIVGLSSMKTPPQIDAFSLLTSNSRDFFTLVMLDMDFPERDSFDRRSYLLWMVVNITLSNTSGNEVVHYTPPLFSSTTSLRRVFFVMFRQSQLINIDVENFSEVSRDHFVCKTLVTRYGVVGPSAIDGCYVRKDADDKSITPVSVVDGSSPVKSSQRSSKRISSFKYYSALAKRASPGTNGGGSNLTPLKISDSSSSPKTDTSPQILSSTVNSPTLSSSVASPTSYGAVEITNINDDSAFDKYLALPVVEDGLSRDTSTASTVTKESRRVSFQASTASMTNDGKLVGVLKHNGSRVQKRKTVSFGASETRYNYVVNDVLESIQLDIFEGDDIPDYDVGAGQQQRTFHNGLNSPPPPPSNHSPPRPMTKTISGSTNRSVNGIAHSTPLDGDLSPSRSMTAKRSSSLQISADSTASNEQSERHVQSEKLAGSNSLLGLSLGSPDGSNSPVDNGSPISPQRLSRGTSNTSYSASHYVELILALNGDLDSLCTFFRVSNQSIFTGGKVSFNVYEYGKFERNLIVTNK